MLKNKMIDVNNKLAHLFCYLGCFLYSVLSSLLIMKTQERFKRNCMHISFGYLGGEICNYKFNYGIIYFVMLLIYQILEEIENLKKYKQDNSFYDIEGYIIGFVGNIIYYYLKKQNNNYELDN
jgi:hypothetical protein